MSCTVSPCFHCVGLILSALSPSGLGSRWLSWVNSTSDNEFRPVWAPVTGVIETKRTRVSSARTVIWMQLVSCELGGLGSAGCYPAVVGSLPATFEKRLFGKLPKRDRMAACAPQIYTRERLRPLFRVYFTGRRRFGSILVSPVPLFTSMI